MADGGIVALALKPDALADDCERAVLLVTAKPAPPRCAATVVDIARLRSRGAMAFRRTGRGFVVEAIKPRGVNRPWATAAESDVETERATAAARLSTPRAVDATPAESDLQVED